MKKHRMILAGGNIVGAAMYIILAVPLCLLYIASIFFRRRREGCWLSDSELKFMATDIYVKTCMGEIRWTRGFRHNTFYSDGMVLRKRIRKLRKKAFYEIVLSKRGIRYVFPTYKEGFFTMEDLYDVLNMTTSRDKNK